MQYYIQFCNNSWLDLPVQPPVELDKIWTIIKTEAALIITCNNVEVLNYQFADSSDMDHMYHGNCVSKWGGDVVEDIRFDSYSDSASDFYKAGISLLLS